MNIYLQMVEQKFDMTENHDLAYDLRQRYAKLVGDHIEIMAIKRIQKDYPGWLSSMDSLYTIVEFKFKERTKEKQMTFEKIKTLVDGYQKIYDEVVKFANKYQSVWFGKSKDPKQVFEIENSLRTLERWLYHKMNEANMFGSKRDVEGLI